MTQLAFDAGLSWRLQVGAETCRQLLRRGRIPGATFARRRGAFGERSFFRE
jgi:hypothetical protein